MNEIRELYHNHAGTLGYRLISDLLERKNIHLSYPTTFKYMQEMGIKATLQKKKLKYTKGIIHKTLTTYLNKILRLVRQMKYGVLILHTWN